MKSLEEAAKKSRQQKNKNKNKKHTIDSPSRSLHYYSILSHGIRWLCESNENLKGNEGKESMTVRSKRWKKHDE